MPAQICRSALVVATQNIAPKDARTTGQRAHIGTYELVVLDAQNAGSARVETPWWAVVMCAAPYGERFTGIDSEEEEWRAFGAWCIL